MSQVDLNNVSATSSLGELGPTTSLQLMFAKLQLELAETAKTQAMDKMDAIAKVQDEQKLVSQLLNEARQAKADANSGIAAGTQSETYSNGTTEKNTKNCTLMSKEMVDYMDAHGLAYDKTGGDYNHSSDEWDVAITALESRLEELGTNTQQEMVYVQDYMGQYNSYLQGANTQIANSNQTLTNLARGSSRQTGRRHPPQGASMSQITEQEKDIQSALLDMAKAAGFTEKEFHTIQAALEKGATLADVFNISKDTLESGYAYAYNLYKAGNYKDAESMFRGLCMYDGDDPRYWMGLAGCLQAREAWQQAIDTYGMAGVAGGLKDPAPFYYGGLCYLKLGDGENAAASFRAALGLGDASIPAHKAVHDRIRALLATLSQSKE